MKRRLGLPGVGAALDRTFEAASEFLAYPQQVIARPLARLLVSRFRSPIIDRCRVRRFRSSTLSSRCAIPLPLVRYR
jgi:hypothetical protein